MSKKVVIDCGHGGSGSTPGKRSSVNKVGRMVYEWDMNNAVGLKIQALLRNYDVEVYRTDDTTGKTDISLNGRVAKTNAYNPDVFVSIHHNAGGGTGTETYYHTQGSAKDKQLASIIQNKMTSHVKLRNRGVKHERFAVLGCKSSIPAVLVEGGFYDTKSDFDYLMSDAGQQAYAEAVVEGIVEFLGLKKVNNSNPSQPAKPSGSSNSSLTGTNFLVRIKCDELNIRQSASFDSKVVGVVRKGEVYTIVGTQNGLGKLKSGAGYISMGSAYVEKVNGTTTPANNTFKVKIVNCSVLNVRKGPGTSYSVATSVKKGEVYTITQTQNGWGKLKSGAGWISLSYTQKI